MSIVSIGSAPVFTSAKELKAGTNIAAGSGVCISSLAPGPVTLIMADGSLMTVFAVLGTMVLPGLSVQGVKTGAEQYATVFSLS